MTHNDPHSQAADAVHEGRPVEGQYVKQGKGGVRISIVLAAAFVLTAIGFFVVYLAYSGAFSSANANDGDQAVDAAAFQDAGEIPAADAPTAANGTGEAAPVPTGEAPNVNAPTAPST